MEFQGFSLLRTEIFFAVLAKIGHKKKVKRLSKMVNNLIFLSKIIFRELQACASIEESINAQIRKKP